jgi:hypothetical protein
MDDAVVYILWPFGLYYGRLAHFVVIWHTLWPFGNFFPVWYGYTKENLATLASVVREHRHKSRDGTL